MPNRILRDSLRYSKSVDELSWFQECLFYRLIVSCDDFGRYYADPTILKHTLFPLKDLDAGDVDEALKKLGAEGMVTVYRSGGTEYVQLTNWQKYQKIRNKKSKYPDPEDDLQPDEDKLKPFADNCRQLRANVPVIQTETETYTESMRRRNTRAREDDGAASELMNIQHDHDAIFDAAEDAGFQMSNASRIALVDLYASYGLDRVMYGIRECVQHGACNLAYLGKVCEGKPRPAAGTGGKRVIAQMYEQRSYDDVQESLEEMAARLEGAR